jgi:hypothetical protein
MTDFYKFLLESNDVILSYERALSEAKTRNSSLDFKARVIKNK